MRLDPVAGAGGGGDRDRGLGRPAATAPEGPYGDHTGYYNAVEPFPVLRVSALTRRRQPIYLSTFTGRPPDEPSRIGEALNALFLPFVRRQFPEIEDLWMPPEACSYRVCIAAIRKSYPGHARRVMMGLWSMLPQLTYTKLIIVVHVDIAVRDWQDVIWAIATRADPSRDLMLIDGTPIDVLDFAHPAHRPRWQARHRRNGQDRVGDGTALRCGAGAGPGGGGARGRDLGRAWSRLGPRQRVMPRVVVGISGASGAAIGVRVVELLAEAACEVHLVVSRAAERTLAHECGETALARVVALAARHHPIEDIGAAIASGSFRTLGMFVAPCSMRTLAAIAWSAADNLLVRAADVTLKERRPLVLLARESPLHLGHLRAMVAVTEMGAIVAPPVPSFCRRPRSVAEIIDHIARRAIGQLGIDSIAPESEWQGG